MRRTLQLARRQASQSLVVFVLLADSPAAVAQAVVEYVRPRPATLTDALSLTGSVGTPLHAALSPKTAGLVQAMRVDAGDRVKSGDPVVQLDATLARLNLRRAEAAVEEARARLAEARRLADEGESLASRGTLPKSVYLARRSEAALAQAALKGLEAERDVQAERVSQHTLTAPFAGVVGRRLKSPGEWVEPGTPVLDLVATNPLRVDVRVPQGRFASLTRGAAVEVRADADPARAIPGRIEALVPVADPQARSFLVRIAVDDPPAGLTPGMSVRVKFELAGGERALSIPSDALVRFPDGSSIVWLLRSGPGGESVTRRPVEVGAQRAETVVVLGGLAPHDRVVVRGNEALKEGEQVSASAFRAAAR